MMVLDRPFEDLPFMSPLSTLADWQGLPSSYPIILVTAKWVIARLKMGYGCPVAVPKAAIWRNNTEDGLVRESNSEELH